MIFTPDDLDNFLKECQIALEAINHVNSFIDDSHVVKGLTNISRDKQLMLLGIYPDYGADSSDDDSLMMNNGLDFLILKKVEYSNLDNDEFRAVLQETLMATREFVKLIFKKKNEGCSQFALLKNRTLQIVPVWAKAGCNGYMVSFSLRTDL